jgi:pimeloyl-ACP methyl ester carboxylesterase
VDAALFREPRRRRFALPDGEMSALDFGDETKPVDVIFAHANGFNAQTYRHALSPLASALRILAVDQRGHGESRLPADPARQKDWGVFGADLVALLDTLDGPPAVLAGHSMGATAAILAAAQAQGRVRALVLFDPVLLPPAFYLASRLPLIGARMAARNPLATRARARRSVFADRPQAMTAYKGRGAFKRWPDAVLADYVAGGFRDRPDGCVELACAPAWEAANYAAHGRDPVGVMRGVAAPVRILKAEHGSTCRLEPRKTGQANVSVKIVPGSSHFLPMERADVVRAQLLDAAAL